jgi:LL-diaminopimelate aminotransferase
MTAEQMTENNIKALYSESIRDMETYIMFRIAQRVVDLTQELTAKGRPPIRLSMGAPTLDPPKVLTDELKKALDQPGMHTYSTPKGEPFFRNAVSERMKNRFGVDIDPAKEVCSLIGSKEGLANMFRALISYRSNPAEQEVIMVPDPGYASYGDAIRICGGIPYSMPLVPENNYLPDFETMMNDMRSQGITPDRVKGLVLNYPSNPIGALAGMDYYRQAVDFCRKYNILLINDVAYADVYFPGEEPPHSVLEVPGAKDITIEFHSMSKPYATTGWRIGFAVGHRDAIDALERVKGTVDSGLFKALQKAAAFAMNSPECFEFVQAQNKQYQINQEQMLAGFKTLGWPVEEVSPPKATFYLWMPIPPSYATATEFSDALLEKSGVVVVPGTAFGKYGEGFFRMSLVDTTENLAEVIRRMQTDGFTYN